MNGNKDLKQLEDEARMDIQNDLEYVMNTNPKDLKGTYTIGTWNLFECEFILKSLKYSDSYEDVIPLRSYLELYKQYGTQCKVGGKNRLLKKDAMINLLANLGYWLDPNKNIKRALLKEGWELPEIKKKIRPKVSERPRVTQTDDWLIEHLIPTYSDSKVKLDSEILWEAYETTNEVTKKLGRYEFWKAVKAHGFDRENVVIPRMEYDAELKEYISNGTKRNYAIINAKYKR